MSDKHRQLKLELANQLAHWQPTKPGEGVDLPDLELAQKFIDTVLALQNLDVDCVNLRAELSSLRSEYEEIHKYLDNRKVPRHMDDEAEEPKPCTLLYRIIWHAAQMSGVGFEAGQKKSKAESV